MAQVGDYCSGMDLKQQLVIWKRSGWLIKNLVLEPKLKHTLVDMKLFTADMMAEVQSQPYDILRNLKMLMLLGHHGTDCFPKFLKALEYSDHIRVALDLERTFKKIKFGEMLPPSFTYFMDMSEFLSKHPHIKNKLGEEGKHILETFIAGKLEIENKKQEEHIRNLENQVKAMKEIIKELQQRLKEAKERERELEKKLEKTLQKMEALKDRVKTLEDKERELREEIRTLKYFRTQQEELSAFLDEEHKQYSALPKMPDVHVETDLENIEPSEFVRLRILKHQTNAQIKRLQILQIMSKHVATDEKNFQTLWSWMHGANAEKVTKEIKQEVKNISNGYKTERKYFATQIKDAEVELAKKEKELVEHQGRLKQPLLEQLTQHASRENLQGQLESVLEGMRKQYLKKLQDKQKQHELEIAEWDKRMILQHQKHKQEVEKLNAKVQAKMMDYHRREMLHKRIRNKINLIVTYNSKNMNATISVEECRKVVRSIIQEARNLRDICEGRDKEKEKLEQENENNNVEEKKPKKSKKKKKKRKLPPELCGENLSYLANHIGSDWRSLGVLLRLSRNRMELLELEAGIGQIEKQAFLMLTTWRDEDKGKTETIVEALLKYGRRDLAEFMAPKGYWENRKVEPESENESETEKEKAQTEEEEAGQEVNPAENEKRSSIPSLPTIPRHPLVVG